MRGNGGLFQLYFDIILYHRQTDDDIELYRNITETNHRFLAFIA